MITATYEETKEIANACADFLVAHARRAHVSKYATLGELDALWNLKFVLREMEKNDRSEAA